MIYFDELNSKMFNYLQIQCRSLNAMRVNELHSVLKHACLVKIQFNEVIFGGLVQLHLNRTVFFLISI